jgi:hypothetical protein
MYELLWEGNQTADIHWMSHVFETRLEWSNNYVPFHYRGKYRRHLRKAPIRYSMLS